MAGLAEFAIFAAKQINRQNERTDKGKRDLIYQLMDDYLEYELDDYDYEEIIDAVKKEEFSFKKNREELSFKKDIKSKKRDILDETNLMSAYRFVELSDKIAPAQEVIQRPCNNLPLEKGLCAEIEVRWAAETPISVGEDQKNTGISDPFQIAGRPCLPGSSIRGMLRSASEIIAHARLQQANRHYIFPVRDFTHPLFMDESDDPLLSWPATKAGWLRFDPISEEEKERKGLSDYVIIPTEKYKIKMRDLPAAFTGKQSPGKHHKTWLNMKLAAKYNAAKNIVEEGKETLWCFDKSHKFKLVDPKEGKVVAGNGDIDGVFVFSMPSPTTGKVTAQQLDEQDREEEGKRGGSNDRNKSNYKKYEYVLSSSENATPHRLKQEIFEKFTRLYSEPNKQGNTPIEPWSELIKVLERRGRVPVFFFGDITKQDRNFDLGLTRLFKRGHANSVDDVLSSSGHKLGKLENFKPDWVEALFGYVYEESDFQGSENAGDKEISRGARIAFEHAMLEKDIRFKKLQSGDRPLEGVMMAPRASFAPFYLKGEFKDWSYRDAKVAGRKRYFPRFEQRQTGIAEQNLREKLRQSTINARNETISKMRFLVPDKGAKELVFKGRIKLHNCTEAELGMILWVLTHGGDAEKPYRHMIGRAKNFGAGQVRVASLKLNVKYNLDPDREMEVVHDWETGNGSSEGWLVADSCSMVPYLKAFHDAMALEVPNWPSVGQVQEFLGVSSIEFGAELRERGLDQYPGSFKSFGNLKNASKLIVNGQRPSNTTLRWMAAPKQHQIKEPYLK